MARKESERLSIGRKEVLLSDYSVCRSPVD